MTTPEDREEADFEQRSRAVLEESVARVDGHVRSRLNQARHAALAQLGERRSGNWRYRAIVPAGLATAAAVTLIAVVSWNQKAPPTGAITEDVELLADGEAFELLEDENSFYEWAVAEEAGS